jgi:hypothetical protein
MVHQLGCLIAHGHSFHKLLLCPEQFPNWCHTNNPNIFDLRFLQWLLWRIECSGMYCPVVQQTLTDFLEEHTCIVTHSVCIDFPFLLMGISSTVLSILSFSCILMFLFYLLTYIHVRLWLQCYNFDSKTTWAQLRWICMERDLRFLQCWMFRLRLWFVCGESWPPGRC